MLLKFPVILSNNSFSPPIIPEIIPWKWYEVSISTYLVL